MHSRTVYAGSEQQRCCKPVSTGVSSQWSTLGAYQNRLESIIRNLDNVVQNTQPSESGIRDTDMAEEMVKYSDNQILQQAGQSVLVQAAQAANGVMKLLT